MVEFLKYKQFEKTLILLCVRWYFRYPLSYRHLVEMMDVGIAAPNTCPAPYFLDCCTRTLFCISVLLCWGAKHPCAPPYQGTLYKAAFA